MELDIWLPNQNLAIEYQGEQHYHDLRGSSSVAYSYQLRDKMKFQLCQASNIALLVVPYWWDGNPGSIVDLSKEFDIKLSSV